MTSDDETMRQAAETLWKAWKRYEEKVTKRRDAAVAALTDKPMKGLTGTIILDECQVYQDIKEEKERNIGEEIIEGLKNAIGYAKGDKSLGKETVFNVAPEESERFIKFGQGDSEDEEGQ